MAKQRKNQPVEQQIICLKEDNMFVAGDRRTGQVALERTGEKSILLEADQVIAIWRLLETTKFDEVVARGWRKRMYDRMSPLGRELMDWVDTHFAALDAGAPSEEQDIAAVLGQVEARYTAPLNG